MNAVLRPEDSHTKGLHILKSPSEHTPRLVLIANKLWLLRHLRRFAAHLNIRLDTLRSLEDLDSISSLNRYDMILLLEGTDVHDDLYTMQCIHLFWGELPILLITSHDFYMKPFELPSNVKATLREELGWKNILGLAIDLYNRRDLPQKEMSTTHKLSDSHIVSKGRSYEKLIE